MALGTGVSGSTDSLFLTVTSGVAIGVVFLLVVLLIILRTRYAASRRRSAMRMEAEMEKNLALRILTKPTLHEVWVAKTDLERPTSLRINTSGEILHDSEKMGLGITYEWNKVMPLSAIVNQDGELQQQNPSPVPYSIGVFVQLPQPRTSDSTISETQGVGAASDPGYIEELNIVLGLNQSFVNSRPL